MRTHAQQRHSALCRHANHSTYSIELRGVSVNTRFAQSICGCRTVRGRPNNTRVTTNTAAGV